MAAWHKKVSRDLILFAVGLSGIVHETITSGAERPALLGLFGAMVGLPLFLRADESKNDK